MTRQIREAIRRLLARFGYEVNRIRYPGDFTSDDIRIVDAARPFTLLSQERLYALIHATRYVCRSEIPGDIVECGVWRGGAALAIEKTLADVDNSGRQIYLFDTFSGMPEPGIEDSHKGEPASTPYERHRLPNGGSTWNAATIDEVRTTLRESGADMNRIHLIEGRVEDTIPEQAPEQISLMHLDTDWYRSTKHELIHLFPRLSRGGVLDIDDYGHWDGQRKAVDEYIAQEGLQLLLNRVDYTGRIAVKP